MFSLFVSFYVCSSYFCVFFCLFFDVCAKEEDLYVRRSLLGCVMFSILIGRKGKKAQ
jgi:hypothetical protein